jgi:hypothetical protein
MQQTIILAGKDTGLLAYAVLCFDMLELIQGKIFEKTKCLFLRFLLRFLSF